MTLPAEDRIQPLLELQSVHVRYVPWYQSHIEFLRVHIVYPLGRAAPPSLIKRAISFRP